MRKAKATKTLWKLQNSKVCQPLGDFWPTQRVKVWRRKVTHSNRRGKRHGFKTVKPRWKGPGRALFTEVQEEDDTRRHVGKHGIKVHLWHGRCSFRRRNRGETSEDATSLTVNPVEYFCEEDA